MHIEGKELTEAANPDYQKKFHFNKGNKFNTTSGEQNNESSKQG